MLGIKVALGAGAKRGLRLENDELTALPAHLKPLVAPTPSGVAKLISAWNGLSVETQIRIITSVDERKLAPYLLRRVQRKAMDSPNAYVRYLAARKLNVNHNPDEDEKTLRSRIEADPDPLVRHCLLETEHNFFDRYLNNAAAFFSLPQEARLAKVRELSGSGETVASLAGYALDNCVSQGKVSQIELYEILADYLCKPSFREYYQGEVWAGGDVEYGAGKDIEALWELAARVPPKISAVLIDTLPEKAGLGSGIPQGVIDKLTNWQLERLLWRADIVLAAIRRSIFARPTQDPNSFGMLRAAAVSSNFDLSYDVFTEILARPEAERAPILSDLTYARDLKLVFYEALRDVLARDDRQGLQEAPLIECSLARRARALSGWRREDELRELRLYIAAREAAPWDSRAQAHLPQGELKFLAELCVPGNTWATFMNFSREWARTQAGNALDKLLPAAEPLIADDLISG